MDLRTSDVLNMNELYLQSEVKVKNLPSCEQLPFYRQSMGLEEARYVHVALGNKHILTKIFANRIIGQLFYHTTWLFTLVLDQNKYGKYEDAWAVNTWLPSLVFLSCNLKALA